MMSKAPEIPRDEAYDRAYYESYGIDPDEVLPKREPARPEREPRFTNGICWFEAYWIGDAVAVVAEDPNGPHPTAYEYEHITSGCWTLYQVYPLERGRVWEWARARGLKPMNTVDGCGMGGMLYSDLHDKDLSEYYTEEPAPPMEGERTPTILEQRAREEREREEQERGKPGRKSAILPAAFDPGAEREEPKPERKRRGGLFAAIGIKFEL
jgi:hypothetical protein